MSRRYKIIEGGIHDRFSQSRAKIQMFAGGFGNGKTTGAVVKMLQIAKDYPGANILVARSTYPKLNDTIRKEVLAWTPAEWIKRKVLSGSDNMIELKNGTTINFRYVAQQGKNAEQSTSNLLSATYDLIVVDQVEDPEITEKDFLDLMGRLRGQARYQGEDATMPPTGPRWMILMCNPTRNWVYRKLVKPVHDLKAGLPNKDLMIDEDTGSSIIEVFEGSTYENKENLPADFIKGLETTYKGQMRERFLMGQWGAYEGLVYPQYSPFVHMINHNEIVDYYNQLVDEGIPPSILESYDHGIASPSCYLFGFCDHVGNVVVMDGLYKKEQTIKQLADAITKIRGTYDVVDDDDADFGLSVLADPAVFKRSTGRTGALTVAGLFGENGIRMRRAENDILSGIAKVQSYLEIDRTHFNPFTDTVEAPHLYVSNNLDFFDKEIVDYVWKRANDGEYEDLPRDKNDHAMDTIKYLLSNRPRLASMIRKPSPRRARILRRWVEKSSHTDRRMSRHG
jgi:phage terminase large subunit